MTSQKSTSTGRPTYGFRLKFHLPAGRIFKGVHPRRRIFLDNIVGRVYLVKLPQPKRHRFGVPTRHALVGKGFKTHEAALACGQRLKGAIALFAAERRLGLDAGNDKSTSSFSQAIKDAIAAQHGCQPREDVHGLDVYVEQPPVTRLAVEGYGSSSYVIEDYENRLRDILRCKHLPDPKQQLALDLYNPDFSVVLFRSTLMLFSEKNRMKVHKNQWFLTMLYPLVRLAGATSRGQTMTPEGQKPSKWLCLTKLPSEMYPQPIVHKALSWGAIRKSVCILAEITIRKSQKNPNLSGGAGETRLTLSVKQGHKEKVPRICL